jgi:uncharacterized protein (DUF4415 family)
VKKKLLKSYVTKQDEALELDAAWFEDATFVEGKKPRRSISLRVDQPLLDWYKSFGRGYQSRMHSVLEAYAKAHQGRGRRKS